MTCFSNNSWPIPIRSSDKYMGL